MEIKINPVPNVSFLLITFYLDFDLLKNQLDSVRLYLKDHTQYPYTIVLNDDIRYLPELERIISHYPEMTFNLLHKNNYSNRYVDPILNDPDNTSQVALTRKTKNNILLGFGFFTQQMLKIVSATEVKTEYCIIVDTKCAWNRLIDLNTFIYNNKMHTMPLHNEYKNNNITLARIKVAYQAFDLELTPSMIDRVRDFSTPFLIKTKYATDLITYLENKEIFVNDLIYCKNNWDRQTFEFFIYSAWIEKYCNEDLFEEDLVIGHKLKSYCTHNKHPLQRNW